MTPDEERTFARRLMDRISVAAFELNLALQAAAMIGRHVPVDTAERDGWTEVVVHPDAEGEDDRR
jgi:hypothetical protein